MPHNDTFCLLAVKLLPQERHPLSRRAHSSFKQQRLFYQIPPWNLPFSLLCEIYKKMPEVTVTKSQKQLACRLYSLLFYYNLKTLDRIKYDSVTLRNNAVMCMEIQYTGESNGNQKIVDHFRNRPESSLNKYLIHMSNKIFFNIDNCAG